MVASAVVLDAEGTWTLLVRDHERRRWTLVSGHATGGEPLAEAARREVRDQTGLTRFVVVEPHMAVQQDLLPCQGVETRHVDHVFAVRVDALTDISLGPVDGWPDACWLSAAELPWDVAPGVALHLRGALRAAVGG
jgi:ADP-ribose pyrophosphatase YjhB (NUDIX family)